MLTQLTIKNYALIKHLEMQPDARLNVITGETGAGKSIMLGALGLLLGNRADTKALWDESEKCVTEATFEIKPYKLKKLFDEEGLDYQDQSIFRREISPAGKSRAFINDTPVTLEVMRRIGSRLMDIHSQHETLELGTKAFQLQVIDFYAGNETLRNAYEEAWTKFTRLQQDYLSLQKEAEALKKESDFVQFQLNELVKADLQPGELEKLETELKILEHSEEIKANLNSILELLDRSEQSVQIGLNSIRQQLQSIASYAPTYEQLLQRFESSRIEVIDITKELEAAEEQVEFDPERAERVKDRVSLIYHLQQKHRINDLQELLALQDQLQQKADKHQNLDDLLLKANKELNQAKADVEKAGGALSKSRKKITTALSNQLKELLRELGMNYAEVVIEHSQIDPGPTGIDAMEILFSANRGVAPKPLAQVASGGEFARVMFAIKYIMAEKTALPTLILDEIDTGVSGEIAIKLGARMKEMAQKHQVIAISHLPQIAAKADTHFFVFKENSTSKTKTSIRNLDSKERVIEIAKMIGGATPTQITLENARELMNR